MFTDIQKITSESYEVIILDNGIGINKAKTLDKLISNKSNAHSSDVLKERLYFLNNTSLWNIEYKIEDCLEISNTTGTKVSLVIKNKNYED